MPRNFLKIGTLFFLLLIFISACSSNDTNEDIEKESVNAETKEEFGPETEEINEIKDETEKMFYKDAATKNNMGTKEMIKEIKDIAEIVDLAHSQITLAGYQFTEFIPNEYTEPRFENFDKGVVLLTVKTEITNNEEKDLALSHLSARLTFNYGAHLLRNELALMPYKKEDIIKQGNTSEWVTTFVLDKEQYETVWKDREFQITIGPLKDEKNEDISLGQMAEFVLPE